MPKALGSLVFSCLNRPFFALFLSFLEGGYMELGQTRVVLEAKPNLQYEYIKPPSQWPEKQERTLFRREITALCHVQHPRLQTLSAFFFFFIYRVSRLSTQNKREWLTAKESDVMRQNFPSDLGTVIPLCLSAHQEIYSHQFTKWGFQRHCKTVSRRA